MFLHQQPRALRLRSTSEQVPEQVRFRLMEQALEQVSEEVPEQVLEQEQVAGQFRDTLQIPFVSLTR